MKVQAIAILSVLSLLAAGANPAPGAGASPSVAPTAHETTIANRPTAVWLFCGLPGDAQRAKRYRELLGNIRGVLIDRFGIPGKSISTWYDAETPWSKGLLTGKILERELGDAQEFAERNGSSWIFFLGHSSLSRDGVCYNLTGQDPTGHEMGEWLGPGSTNASVTVIMTTSLGGRYLEHFAGASRTTIGATAPDDPVNETCFPHALAMAMADEAVDTNADRMVSATELFRLAARNVREFYDEMEFVLCEHAVLDGDGNGHGTRRPSRRDAEAAGKKALPLSAGLPTELGASVLK